MRDARELWDRETDVSRDELEVAARAFQAEASFTEAQQKCSIACSQKAIHWDKEAVTTLRAGQIIEVTARCIECCTDYRIKLIFDASPGDEDVLDIGVLRSKNTPAFQAGVEWYERAKKAGRAK